ncbi:hypothetical protein [Cystobacter ferrugineus]|uniref:Lipoprotein n=1 Tax=Cystobacter ferrugineus TaxID=83449 RepID=A0A1L9B430_9BACT|nr:hypothetical protein [Cystobacter ferrugineus]OJH37004.1 hypothetical protein BON30_31460 [Cystobacter ferrugineus]
MRHWMRVGCMVLSASAMACANQLARSPAPTSADEEAPVAVSVGGGGGATVDTGQFPSEDTVAEPAGAKHELYEQVARELNFKRESPKRLDEGAGGAGVSEEEKHVCANALNSPEQVTVVSGIINYRSSGLVVIDVPGKGPVKLRTDDVTCTVQAGKALPPEALSEGTEARVAYVEDAGEPTARVIRAEPMRFLR